jgi:hypothetical protein
MSFRAWNLTGIEEWAMQILWVYLSENVHLLRTSEFDETGSGSCLFSGFCVSDIKLFYFLPTVLVYKAQRICMIRFHNYRSLNNNLWSISVKDFGSEVLYACFITLYPKCELFKAQWFYISLAVALRISPSYPHYIHTFRTTITINKNFPPYPSLSD